MTSDGDWYEEDDDVVEEGYPIDQYDISAAPNDFNITTIYNFIESGVVKIPGFQRHYVWDRKRASKLIESLVIGLPVPQVFLYEEGKNDFLVIDGQQRLMSIYYFMKQKFPLKEKRGELRRVFEREGRIPDDVLNDDNYFAKFNLQLPAQDSDQPNRFHGLNYNTLGEYKTTFELRTVRNIVVKQISPRDDDSAVYEIFNRLNTGGINLTSQEIRMSLYHCSFFDSLLNLNTRQEWRRLLNLPEPDIHMKDVEFLLRGFAMLVSGEKYSPSMLKFLNKFSKSSRKFPDSYISYLESLFDSFLDGCRNLPPDAFMTKTKRFSITIFESVFRAACITPCNKKQLVQANIEVDFVDALRNDLEFTSAAERRTTDKKHVTARLRRAEELLAMA